MSLYSGALKTHILDDVSFSQNRVEFRFDANTMFYSNLRLVNLGLKGVATTYNPLAGCYGTIKHIRLLDGRKEISAMRFANRYMAFDNLLASNVINRDTRSKQTKNKIGYSLDKNQQLIQGGAPNAAARTESITLDASGKVESLGSLDLRKCLPILNKISVLDTEMFENLRVEIEGESDLRNQIVAQASGAQTKVECILICDEILDDKLQDANRRQMGAVVWNEIEHDLFQVPDATATAGALGNTAVSVQAVNHKINGFDGKLIDRVIMSKCYSDKTKNLSGTNVVGFGDLGSLAQHKQKVNITLNGGRVFPGDGLDKPNDTLALLCDTFGDVNLAPFQNLTAVGLDQKNVNSVHKEGVEPLSGNNHNDQVGQADFIGFTVSERINDLQINYERTLVKDTETIQKYNLGLDVHVYCEVSKSLIPVKGGEYIVKYN